MTCIKAVIKVNFLKRFELLIVYGIVSEVLLDLE